MSDTAEHARFPECFVCQAEMDWQRCTECGGEVYVEHDCGEDTCCCADPEPNVMCETCEGDGGWWRCFDCNPGCADED